MEARKEQILSTIIKEYIKTAVPVGSGVLVDKYKLKVSPATVRNEMGELEEEGYIMQPHTSAGRVPTEKAYKLFLKNLSVDKEKIFGKNDLKEIEELTEAIERKNEDSFKEAAKLVSSISGNAVFWAFHRHNIYYTGISKLFQQPEFSQIELIYDISSIIDRIDEIINRIFNELKMGENILIGSENPFGNFCSSIMAKYKLDDKTGIFGIIGPMRMNYEKNLGLVEFINKILTNN